jgi:hypothetical protein
VRIPLGRPRLWHLPLRLATGAFLLNSGLNMREADDETTDRLQSTAVIAFPFLKSVPSDQFAKLLSTTQIGIGAALLNPVVPPFVAGSALAVFSGGLLRIYLKAPGMHEEGTFKPTGQGTPMAKDVWMFSIGLALVLDAIGSSRRKKHKQRKQH